MSIKVVTRFKPFMQEMGEPMLVPGTLNLVEVYPRCLLFEDGELPMAVSGPVEKFQVTSDCEKGWVRVSYLMNGEYISYRLKGDQPLPKERLSLGVHKAQDWRLVKRRLDLREVLPLWYFMAPQVSDGQMGPMSELVDEIEGLIQKKERLSVGAKLMYLFQAGFEGMLVPTEHDQGFGVSDDVASGIPWGLLGKTRELIRRLFIKEDAGVIELLPCLPVEARAGRFVDIQMDGFELDMEWRKGEVRRVALRAKRGGLVRLKVAQKTMRLHGKQIATSESLHMEPGESLFLDRFQS